MSQSQQVHLAASPPASGRRRRARRLGERQEETKQANWGKVPRKEDLAGRQTSLQAGAVAYGYRDFHTPPQGALHKTGMTFVLTTLATKKATFNQDFTSPSFSRWG